MYSPDSKKLFNLLSVKLTRWGEYIDQDFGIFRIYQDLIAHA